VSRQRGASIEEERSQPFDLSANSRRCLIKVKCTNIKYLKVHRRNKVTKFQNHRNCPSRHDTWREIKISLTHRVERSKSRVVRIREVRTRENITSVYHSEIIETVCCEGGHMVRDQHFADS
jgi:hypothetical protein